MLRFRYYKIGICDKNSNPLRGINFKLYMLMLFLILRSINKRHSSLKIKTDHRKWPFVIKTLVKVCFILLKICRYGHQKICIFKPYSTEKKYQNNEKQPSGNRKTRENSRFCDFPNFSQLNAIDRIFSNVCTNCIEIGFARQIFRNLYRHIFKKIKKSLVSHVFRPFNRFFGDKQPFVSFNFIEKCFSYYSICVS